MIKKHHYYIECTFDDNGKTWQRWSQENYLSFARVKADIGKIFQQELEFNTKEYNNEPFAKIQGFRIVQETIEIKTETISEYLLT